MTTSIAPTNPTSRTSSMPVRCKLTKALFLKIPLGVFLISNCHARNGQPVFAERIAAQGDRQQQWQRILETGAAQRLCLITNSEADFKTMRGAFPRDMDAVERLLVRRERVLARVPN